MISDCCTDLSLPVMIAVVHHLSISLLPLTPVPTLFTHLRRKNREFRLQRVSSLVRSTILPQGWVRSVDLESTQCVRPSAGKGQSSRPKGGKAATQLLSLSSWAEKLILSDDPGHLFLLFLPFGAWTVSFNVRKIFIGGERGG